MIISHKYQFIFIKTVKTAGTSIEVYLSDYCGPDDILPPFGREEFPNRQPRNYKGFFNPFKEMVNAFPRGLKTGVLDFINRQKFREHIHGPIIRCRIPKEIWNSYYKFCVERNPFDKVISHYYFLVGRKNLNLTFDEYLDSKYRCLNYPSYTDYPKCENIIVDRVLRYEKLNEELSEVFGRLGVSFEGALNTKAKAYYRKDKMKPSDLKDYQIAKIKEIYRKEIQFFGYDIEP